MSVVVPVEEEKSEGENNHYKDDPEPEFGTLFHGLQTKKRNENCKSLTRETCENDTN